MGTTDASGSATGTTDVRGSFIPRAHVLRMRRNVRR